MEQRFSCPYRIKRDSQFHEAPDIRIFSARNNEINFDIILLVRFNYEVKDTLSPTLTLQFRGIGTLLTHRRSLKHTLKAENDKYENELYSKCQIIDFVELKSMQPVE